QALQGPISAVWAERNSNINTYDGRPIRNPDPRIKSNDTIKLDLETSKITDFIKFDVGNVVRLTGGRNTARECWSH
ncbi:unnamed protein product, partial [Ilex paraguariensis]